MADETTPDSTEGTAAPAPALEGSSSAAAPAAGDRAEEGVAAATADQAPDPQPADERPEPAADSASGAEPEMEPEPEPEPQAATEPAAEGATQPAAEAEPEAEPATEAEPEPQAAVETAAEPEPEPEREPDPVRDPLAATLSETLGADLLASEVSRGDIWIRVAASSWHAAVQACRDQLGMDYFCFLSGLDWLPNANLSAEKIWDPDETVAPLEKPDTFVTGVAGGDTRFQVFARLYSTATKIGITLKADLDEQEPRVDSIHDLYPGADWHEREAWEMYGFDFAGHPSLRHMYLPGEFEGYPLRKDFPLLAREVKPWPGLVDLEPMPGEPEGDAEADAAAAAEGGE